MALKTKVDYFGLGTSGWEVQSTSEGKTAGYTAEARGDDGFLVKVDVGDDRLAPQCTYIATSDASLGTVVIGSVMDIGGKKIALGSVSVSTAAGSPVTMTASGSQIEDDGSAHCTATLTGIDVSSLFHAQTFGLFEISNGQLQSSTLTIDGNIATADVDGVIKASDLVGASITVSGTIVGVNDNGVISTPAITLTTPSGGKVLSGVLTQPLTEENPNNDFPSYNFTAQFGLKAD